MAKELVSRDQVRVEDTWDLTAMYENKSAWEADIKFIEGRGVRAWQLCQGN